MRKVVALLNITIDGFCDHTAGIPDGELLDYYANELRNAGDLLYGRTTYQLMESYWPLLVNKPTGDQHADDFALAIQNVSKVVFSHTLTNVNWENTRLATKGLEEEIMELKQQNGKDIYVGSPSLISRLTKLNLFDEYRLAIHPVILGSGLPLFKDVSERIVLSLIKTIRFSSGTMVMFYEPRK